MKDDILEQVGRYHLPERLPRISAFAFSLYERAGSRVTDEVVEGLRAALEPFRNDLKALTDANYGLIVFSLYLRDHIKDAEGSERIAEIIRETAPKYLSIGERIVSALQDLAQKATGFLDRFSDRDSAHNQAPMFDDEAKPGLQLKDIKPVGELSVAQRESKTYKSGSK